MSQILLLEDNEANQDLITRYLSLFGHSVELETSGKRGVDRILSAPDAFDVVLLDMNLPELDGWGIAAQLKANPLTQGVPLVALSAHAMVGDREKTLAAGCDEYISKPIDFALLLQTIETLCSAKELVR